MIISVICIIGSLISVQANFICFNSVSQASPEYRLIKTCHRSKLSVAAKGNYVDLSSCKRFALDKRALSINFSPRTAKYNRIQRVKHTCEILQCAEVSGGLYLTNDSRYDYYSLYQTQPTVNATCVPGSGMFYLITSETNYTEAENMCQTKRSILADVTSERRTNALAQFLANSNTTFAYVGLKRNKEDFKALNGDGLECTAYRAWAPGHPKKRGTADCMVITRNRTWKSVSCEEKLPAICELLPGN